MTLLGNTVFLESRLKFSLSYHQTLIFRNTYTCMVWMFHQWTDCYQTIYYACLSWFLSNTVVIRTISSLTGMSSYTTSKLGTRVSCTKEMSTPRTVRLTAKSTGDASTELAARAWRQPRHLLWLCSTSREHTRVASRHLQVGNLYIRIQYLMNFGNNLMIRMARAIWL